MKDRWTTEEYRRFLETGREPDSERQRKIEEAWAKAEREGRVMVLDIPVEGPERQGQSCSVPRSCNGKGRPSVPETGSGVPKRRRKYGNEITYVDGIRFDSKHEAEVYQDLMLQVKSGELKCVLRQVRFDLGGGQNAQQDSRYKYVADFVTVDRDFRIRVLDAKSEATRKNRTYINKKKQMLAEWGIEVEEV